MGRRPGAEVMNFEPRTMGVALEETQECAPGFRREVLETDFTRYIYITSMCDVTNST